MGIDPKELQNLSPQTRERILQQIGKKPNKYRNQPVKTGKLRFDSQKEAERFRVLEALQKAGKIRQLKLQHTFTLQDAYTTPEGEWVRAIEYRADFTYVRDGQLVVEDVKSPATKTQVYQMKRKMLLARYGLTIAEV